MPAGAKSRFRRALDLAETLGAGAYVVGGLVQLLFDAAYPENILPLGTPKSITPGELIPILNFGVGFAVAGGLCSIAIELLEEAREPAEDGS
jgi:multicomponent Na+:H+ antiporter subunit B